MTAEKKPLKNPEISVIVPVYKVEKYLNECIDSILAQTFTDFEVILVDDGSPDNCPAMCDAAAERDERVRVIHKANGGVSTARNAGLAAARGNWVGFVDSDDVIDKTYLEKLYCAGKQSGAEIVACNLLFMREDGSKEAASSLAQSSVQSFIYAGGWKPLQVSGTAALHRNSFTGRSHPSDAAYATDSGDNKTTPPGYSGRSGLPCWKEL